MLKNGVLILNPGEVAKRKEYLEITPADEQRLKEAHSHLHPHAERIIDRFYDFLLGHEPTRAMLSAPGLVDRLKKLQVQYFGELTAGTYDLPYFESRIRIGQVHHRIGLAPEWYLGAYAKYLHIATDVLSSAYGRDYERFFQTLVSLTKIISLDQGLAIDAYHFAAQESIEGKNAELRRSNEEMKRLQSAKRQLTDMIVHDLQNPLTGVTATLQVFQESETKLSPSGRKALGAVLRRCDELFQMIMNVLNVSRSDVSELKTYIENIDLGLLSREVAESMRTAATVEKRKIRVVGPSSLKLRTDQTLVRRILQNLLRNAIRHTPKETDVVIRLGRKKDRIHISIIDAGPGIPEELRPHLFEAHGANALRSAGVSVDTGLGLPSCRVMARAIGAELTVENLKPKGLSFSLHLCLAPPSSDFPIRGI